jgi:Transcriptional regulator, AbiEi antitoxin
VNESAIGKISKLCAPAEGIFRGQDAVALGISRSRLNRLAATGVIERVLPDTYRMTAVRRSDRQSLSAALLWAGDMAAAAGRSAGAQYRLEAVRAVKPELVIAGRSRVRSDHVVVHHVRDRGPLQIRLLRDVPVTGPEATLVALAAALDDEAFEIACEDARRRRLTSVPASRTYLAQYGMAGRPGVAPLRGPPRPTRPNPRGALGARGQDPPAPRREWFHRIHTRVPSRLARAHLPIRLRVHAPANHPRNQRSALARTCQRLRGRQRGRQREMECSRPPRIPHRPRDVGQGDPPAGGNS